MQPTLCSKCKKNVAVVFISRMNEKGEPVNEGLCLKCAAQLGLPQVEDMMKRMGITPDDLENLNSEMMQAFGGAEELGDVAQANEDGDEDEESGKTATFPFLNRLFGGNNNPPAEKGETPQRETGKESRKGEKKHKYLDNYCINLSRRAREGKLDAVIGREEEIQRVVQILNRRQKNNPCLIGEPGVGKTELVKQLADDLFNSPDSLIRLDMSEFMEKHSVSRLVGSPPGYVGYDEAGQLTEKIRRKPYSVVLFDEIEKAHPDVLNILLQILDDGEVTDAHGRKVNFENTVIVMTSNAGSGKAAGAVGFGRSADDQDKERVMKALQEFLRPEFINRVDEIVYFHQLTEENFRGIAGIMLEELKAALEEKGYHFTYDDALVDYLVKKSYSAAYGARNLRRCIRKDVEDPMAARIIESYETPITQIKATAEDGAVKLYTL